MKTEAVANKYCPFGLYGLAIERLNQISKKEIIDFPKVFERLCVTFSITKKQCWELLFILRDFSFIEIIPYHGIKLLKNKNGS